MIMKMKKNLMTAGAMAMAAAMILLVTMAAPLAGYGQAELQPWGNLRGIRLEGQLMPLGTSIRVEGREGGWANATGKERQHPHFSRQGNTQIVQTNLDSLYITERVEDQEQGVARLDIVLNARASLDIDGAWLRVDVPEGVKVVGMVPAKGDEKKGGSGTKKGGAKDAGGGSERMIRLSDPAAHRQWRLSFVNTDTGGVREVKGATGRLDLLIHRGRMQAGDSAHWQLTIAVSGAIDKEPLHLTLNTGSEGKSFAGFGGNFRLQNPAMDPQVIDYCLKNMRVAWARVEMPWAFWQPGKTASPWIRRGRVALTLA